MSLSRRLEALERVPGRRVDFVVVDHWPDGGTRATFLDNGEELPPKGPSWPDRWSSRGRGLYVVT